MNFEVKFLGTQKFENGIFPLSFFKMGVFDEP